MSCVLLVRFSSIGDVVLTTPLVRALRARHPDARLIFVTKSAMAPLVGANPHLSEVVALEPGESVRDLARRLAGRHPTHGLDLHGSLRSRALRLLVPCAWHGFAKRKLARGVLIATKINLYGPTVPVAERYFEAASSLDVHPDGRQPEFFLDQSARERVDRWIVERGLSAANAPLAALAPGAAHATKRWPTERWLALAARLRAAGYALAVVGGAEDRATAQPLEPHAAIAAGLFSLQETGALLARARILVSGDTGVMHMATGVGTPVVALFGPTVEPFGFFPYQARAQVLQRSLDCRPCSTMGGERCPMGHHRCLIDIAPEEVAAAVARLVA